MRIALTLLCAALLAACSHDVPVHPSLNAARPAKIDRTVGIYIPAELEAFTFEESQYGDNWRYPVGAPSARAIEQAAERTFARTYRVKSLPPLPPDGRALDAVLEPSIEHFAFDIPMLKTSTYRAEVRYRFTLHAPTGAVIESWTVDGEGAVKGQPGFDFTTWPGAAADDAIEDAMRRFVEEIDLEPGVKRWLIRTDAYRPAEKGGMS
jgi:hypothetical protein